MEEVAPGVSHAQLLEKVGDIVDLICEQWQKEQRVEPIALTWPASPIKTDADEQIFGAILCQLKNVPAQDWMTALRVMVSRTNAYGLALIERRGGELRVLFETPEGARAWLTPLHRHGDLMALGTTVVRDNTECVGILWRPNRGSA